MITRKIFHFPLPENKHSLTDTNVCNVLLRFERFTGIKQTNIMVGIWRVGYDDIKYTIQSNVQYYQFTRHGD